MLKIIILLFGIFIVAYNYTKHKLISSATIWVFCYMLIFVIYPIWEKDINYNNSLLIDIFALLGIISFFFGLTFGKRLVWKKRSSDDYRLKAGVVPNYRLSSIAFWICCALSIAVLFYLLGTNGVVSILRGSMTAKEFALNKDNSNSLYVFSVHLLVPCILSMWVTAEGKKQRLHSIICLGIYILETVLFGFTRIFLITILAIIVIYEIRNMPQRKQLRIAAVSVLSLLLLLASLNFIRTFGLNSDRSLKNILDLSYIFDSTDFSASYYWFNELLDFKPFYINPIVYLKPIFAFVPRSIWASKPEPLSMQILLHVNPARAAAGYSTAGNSVLGEGYAILGYFGIVIFPFLWGMICGKLDDAYYRRIWSGDDHCLRNIFYYIFAVFIVMSGQRGDWCQYMTIVLWFYMIPMYLLSKFSLRMSH